MTRERLAGSGSPRAAEPRAFRARQRAVRAEAILAATAELVGRVGYEAMSTDDVAARVGISKRTLYGHFPSKELLVVRVVTSEMEAIERAFDAASPAAPAIDRLTDMLTRAVARRMALWSWGQPLPRSTLERHAEYLTVRRRIAERVAGILEVGKREGTVTRALPTPLLVRLIMQWFSMDLSGLAQMTGLPEAEAPAAIVHFMLHGVSRPAPPPPAPVRARGSTRTTAAAAD